MRTFLVLFFIVFLFSNLRAQVANKIDKLDVNQLKLPKESVSKAVYLDATGQVKSSSTISDTELGYLEGLSDTLVNLLAGKANDSDVVKLTGNQTVSGIKTFDGKLVTSSTVNGAIPCPVMTETQRNAFTPAQADCVYNSTTLKINVFDGSVWKDVGGAGGVSLWLTANPYNVNDIVIESDKIYRCLIAHTSGIFATDLAALKWGEVSQGLTAPVSLADGGTNKNITPVSGSIVYVDADSFEQISGTLGQVLQSNGSSAPAFVNKSISAKSQNNTSVTAEEIQVPNNLLTQVDANKHLNETGNKNILSNPSFEHSTFSTSWTNSAGTFTKESTIVIDGKASAKLVLSTQTMSLTQSSALYASSFADGVQGLASIRIKSDVALKMCSIQAGVVSTTNCVDVKTDNKWGFYKVPFILGGTSNGISIASAGAVTGKVYIDDAFVGATDLKVDGQQIDIQSSYIGQTASFSLGATITGAITSSVNSGLYSYNSSTGIYTVLKQSKFVISGSSSTAGNSSHIINVNVNGSVVASGSSSAVSGYHASTAYTGVLSVGDTFYFNIGTNGSSAQKLSVSATEVVDSGTYSSTNADTDWQNCTFSTLAWQGFGTVTSADVKCKRRGSDLLMRGRATTGTVAALEARIPLPTWNGVQLSVKGSSSIPVLTQVGTLIKDSAVAGSSKELSVVTGYGLSYLNISAKEYSLALNPFSPLQGSGFIASTTLFDFNASIPINGWENSNIIIGQFNGLESCTDTLECTDTFSASFTSTGTVVAGSENVDWILGNATITDTSKFAFSINTGIFSAKPNCSATMASDVSAVSQSAVIDITSNIAMSVRTLSGGGKSAQPFTVICQKQGADYIGKTAKAVASSQNNRSPGVENVVTYNGFISSSLGSVVACTSGSCVITGTATGNATSTFVSTGKYSLNFPAGTFDGNSLVSCSFTCHQTSTGFVTYDATLPVLTQSDGSIAYSTLGCIAISDLPSRTNSSIAYKCTGIKK